MMELVNTSELSSVELRSHRRLAIRMYALNTAMEAAKQYGAFDRRLTPNPKKANDEDLGEHWHAISGLADAIFDYIVKEDVAWDSEHVDENVLLFPSNPNKDRK